MEREHGTGQIVRVKEADGDYVVVRVDPAKECADLLLLSSWPARLDTGVSLSRLEVIKDRRSPSTRTVPYSRTMSQF